MKINHKNKLFYTVSNSKEFYFLLNGNSKEEILRDLKCVIELKDYKARDPI